MQTIDYIKLTLVILVFPIGGTLLGFYLKDRPTPQRWIFAAVCFMTINGLIGKGNWGLTILSMDEYRGHAKGFHFYFNHALAWGLVLARQLESPRTVRKLPPGLWLYLVYVLVSFASIINAPNRLYALMAAHKMTFVILVFLAAYHWIRTPERLDFFLRVMAITMIWEALLVVKMKYLDGIYQVYGTFEHQNALAMYTILIGMVFLAVGLGSEGTSRNLLLVSFVGCAVIVQSALSRAGLLVFAGGTATVTLLSLVEKPTKRRCLSVAVMGLLGLVGLVLTLDTLVARFADSGNTASAEYREVLNAAAREMVADYPLGIGWNNYAIAINDPYKYSDFVFEWLEENGHRVDRDRKNSTVESLYYLLLAETGYGGLGLYIGLAALLLLFNLGAFFTFPHGLVRLVSLGIACGAGCNYLQSTLERVLVQPRNLMLWLILFAITSRVETWRRLLVRHRKERALA